MLTRACGATPATAVLRHRTLGRFAAQQRWRSSQSSTHDVAILGGGITGLATAYYLTKALPRAKITIYEASDRVGGWLSAKRVPVKDGNVLFESGPRTLRATIQGALAASLLQELDLAKDTIFTSDRSAAARNRYIYYPDRLTRLPHPSFGLTDNIWSCLTEPALQGAIWDGMTEYFKPQRPADTSDESIGDFFARRFSKGFVDRLVSAMVHGIYAGDVWQLSAKSLFPGPWRNEEAAGSIAAGFIKNRGVQEFPQRDLDYLQTIEQATKVLEPRLKGVLAQTSVFTFKDGLGMLSERLARKCLETGNLEFKTSSPVQEIRAAGPNGTALEVVTGNGQPPKQYTHVISALAPWQLNAITTTKDKTSLIPQIPAVTVMTVNLYYPTPDLTPEGFGYLIPQATSFEQNPERALGVIFDNAYSPSPQALKVEREQLADPDSAKEIQSLRDQGVALDHAGGFTWYDMPRPPIAQDEVSERGTKLTVMLGGHYWNGWPSFPTDQEGLALAKSVVERHLGIKEEPEAWQVNLQRDCIPQYTVGHTQRLKTAHNNLWTRYRGKLRVAGNWMWGVGVNDALRSAWEAANSLQRGRDGTGLEHVGSTEYVRIDLRPDSSQSVEK